MRSSVANRPRFSLSRSLSLFLCRYPFIRAAKNGATSFLIRPKLRVIGTHGGMKFRGTTVEAAITGAAHVREKELLTLVRPPIPFPGEDTRSRKEERAEQRLCIKSNVASRDNRRTISHLPLRFPPTSSSLFRSPFGRGALNRFSRVIGARVR